mmetsp:Transcript_34512/g.63442  ORF Transcript_34512/g.63442 Transcript_34512/m.63442 type:complete len:128 (-) Transcript_34512:53-436(-)
MCCSFAVKDLPTENEVLVIRTKNLWQDWIDVNKILGARRDVDVPDEGSEGERVNAGSMLPVKNTLNARGRQVLCQVLTNEIRIYIDLLNRAVNLSDDDVSAALQGMQANCPSVVKYLGGNKQTMGSM